MDKIIYDPNLNHDVIVIIKQSDGNYIGEMTKYGKLIEVRAGDPNTVLNLLITHDGTNP